jgi:hypothetical protein
LPQSLLSIKHIYVKNINMNQLLERAFQQAQTLPDHRQNEVGEMLLALVEQDQSPLHLSKTQQQEVRRRLALSEDNVPVSDMNAFFRKLVG